MNSINQYTLIVDKQTKVSSLQVKETHSCEEAVLRTPQQGMSLINSLFHMDEQGDEMVYMAAVNIKGHLLGLFELSHGSVSASMVDTRGVFVRALQIGASRIMIFHNHPSGAPTPSREDVAICKKIQEAGELLGIELMDFCIIGHEGNLSFREENLL